MSAQSRVVKGGTGTWMFDAGTHLIKYSCHHREDGACGGCYARAMLFVKDVAKGITGSSGAEALLAELRSEAK